MSNSSLIHRLAKVIEANKNTPVRKDNLTDVASQISQPSSQPSQSQSDNSGNSQNLGSNQVVGQDGTIIDLGINSQDIAKK